MSAQNNLTRNESVMQSDECLIALYYCYTPQPIDDLGEHLQFQTDLCKACEVSGGRIRVSREGLNGVLSATSTNLFTYEDQLRVELRSKYCVNLDDLTLDFKYCKLRPDLDVTSQLFDSLSIKATTEVVSLHELPDHPLYKNFNSQRRRRRKKPHVLPKQDVQHQIYDFDPAPHLSPQEWHEMLSSKSIQHQENKTDAILIDARNVYESNVGYFDIPGIPTLLTNTRKYSSLPQVLEASIEHLSGKEVYMYCTGGVRCERASQYLQKLVQSPKWHGEPPKSIRQLDGGIQRYLEHYGTMMNHDKPYNDNEACLFRGKNFVFDPRRTDPMVGRFSSGKCLVCSQSHDDYDNGNAPSVSKEARCCRCRVLILVCNDCRHSLQCWGEPLAVGIKPVYCGPNGTHCIDEGNHISNAKIIGS